MHFFEIDNSLGNRRRRAGVGRSDGSRFRAPCRARMKQITVAVALQLYRPAISLQQPSGAAPAAPLLAHGPMLPSRPHCHLHRHRPHCEPKLPALHHNAACGSESAHWLRHERHARTRIRGRSERTISRASSTTKQPQGRESNKQT